MPRRRSLAIGTGLVLGLLLALGAGVPLYAQAPPPDPASLWQQFLDAVNRRDVSGAVDLFTVDAVYQDFINCTPVHPACAGRASIEAELAHQISVVQHFTLIDIQVSDTTASGRIKLQGPLIPPQGLVAYRLILDFEFETRDGRIAALRVVPDSTDPDTEAFFNTSPIPWPARAARPTVRDSQASSGRSADTSVPGGADRSVAWGLGGLLLAAVILMAVAVGRGALAVYRRLR